MELEELYKLMKEFGRSGLGKLEYKTDSFSVKMEMPQTAQIYTAVTTPPASDSAAPTPVPAAPAAPPHQNSRPEPPAPAGEFIKSPLVGTYYAAPGENSAPYVTAGAHVAKGETVCIIEAMKMMNEVTAPYDCIIEEILKENAAAAGFEEPLFRIRKI